MSDKLLTVPETAEILSLSKQATYRLIAEKQLPHFKLSERRIGISQKQIENFLASRLVE